jgi:hypothetical protein
MDFKTYLLEINVKINIIFLYDSVNCYDYKEWLSEWMNEYMNELINKWMEYETLLGWY